MDEIEKTALWPDIRKIINSGPKPVRFEQRGIMHTEKEDFDVMKIVTRDILRDYVNNVGDHLNIEILMPLGDYVKRFYPYRQNAEMTISRHELAETGEIYKTNAVVETERYKVIFLPDVNKNVRGSEYDTLDQNTLNLMEVITVTLQLLNRSIEPLRIKTVGGVFKNVNQKQLIHALLAGESMKILIDGKPSIDGLDLVEPDNMENNSHVVIPHGTHITALPTYQQERMNGVYNAGIGTYLQMYDKKRLWFVYPLYNPDRFDENVKKAIFYATPRTRFTMIERTYRVEPDVVYILATSGKQYSDNAETDLMEGGVGFRMSDARSFMKKPIKMTPEGPVGVRNQLNHETGVDGRKDGLNYAPFAGRGISSNPYAEYSRVLQRNGGRVDLTWQNSKPSELYPGMPCKYVFLEGKTIKEVKGVILCSHTVEQLDGEGVTAKSHISTTQVTLFVERLKNDQGY